MAASKKRAFLVALAMIAVLGNSRLSFAEDGGGGNGGGIDHGDIGQDAPGNMDYYGGPDEPSVDPAFTGFLDILGFVAIFDFRGPTTVTHTMNTEPGQDPIGIAQAMHDNEQIGGGMMAIGFGGSRSFDGGHEF
jgi:hypothetical protein